MIQEFEDKATEHLIGKSILPEHLNEHKIYSKDNLELLKQIKWLTRVPLSISEAKNLVSSLSNSEFKTSEMPGYSWVEKESTYGGIKQRWLVVESTARKKSDLEKLAKKIVKEYDSTQKKLAKLAPKYFASSAEANFTIKAIQSKLKYHLISEFQIQENQLKYQETTYKVTGVIQADSESIELLKKRAGRFIIATNRLDSEAFNADEMLKKYKEQQHVERGFAFLKDPLFFHEDNPS